MLYAGEGESRKPDESIAPSFDDSVGSTASLASGARTASIFIKGHEFVQVTLNCFTVFKARDFTMATVSRIS